MRNLVYILFIVFFSCGTDDEISTNTNLPCEEGCGILNPLTFTTNPQTNSIEIKYFQNSIIDAFVKVCQPEFLDFYISEDSIDFVRVERRVAENSSFIIDDLQDGKEYYLRMVNIHCELDSIVSPTIKATVGEIALPSFVGTANSSIEDFRLSSDGNQIIYRTFGDDWFLSTLNSGDNGSLIIRDAFYADWNPSATNKVSFLQQTLVQILDNVNGITSKSLNEYNLSSNTEQILHDIEFLHDFDRETHKPEQYWIHEFKYSIDGTSIYFTSNKDNGSTSVYDKLVFDNIWKLDLSTNEITQLSDFISTQFDFTDFIEDPKKPGNFYITGATDGDVIPGQNFSVDREDIYYFNSLDQSLTTILKNNEIKQRISIDPIGENILYTSNKTGGSEVWAFNLSNQREKQITNSNFYTPTSKWQHLNWISDTEFMVIVNQDGENKFAVFDISG